MRIFPRSAPALLAFAALAGWALPGPAADAAKPPAHPVVLGVDDLV